MFLPHGPHRDLMLLCAQQRACTCGDQLVRTGMEEFRGLRGTYVPSTPKNLPFRILEPLRYGFKVWGVRLRILDSGLGFGFRDLPPLCPAGWPHVDFQQASRTTPR